MSTAQRRFGLEDEPVPAELPPFFWVLFRGRDAISLPPAPARTPSKIVLLHGWLQDHRCWMRTAHKLRDTYGHDVLLFDFYGHGHSPFLRNFKEMNLRTCLLQLTTLLQKVGWGDSAVVLGGLSLGGGVAQHFALQFPDKVAGLVLLASVGSPEPFLRPVPLMTRLFGKFMSMLLMPWDVDNYEPPERITALTRLRGKLWIARRYPDHGLPPETPALLRKHPLSLVWGKFDTLHSPNLRRWLCKGPSSSDSSTPESTPLFKSIATSTESEFTENSLEEPPHAQGPRTDVNILLFPLEHTLFCLSVDQFQLHRFPHYWHDMRSSCEKTKTDSSLPSSTSTSSYESNSPTAPLFQSKL